MEFCKTAAFYKRELLDVRNGLMVSDWPFLIGLHKLKLSDLKFSVSLIFIRFNTLSQTAAVLVLLEFNAINVNLGCLNVFVS